MGIAEPRTTAMIHCKAVTNAIRARALPEYIGVRHALAPHNFPLEDNSNPSPGPSPTPIPIPSR
eukprot:2101529-Rhodomonas_salina.1